MIKQITKHKYNDIRNKNNNLECIVDNGKCIWINKIKKTYYLYLSCECSKDDVFISTDIKELITFTKNTNALTGLPESEKDYFYKACKKKGLL